MTRVAVYCRVSTDSNDQANSLASQKKYFSDYINRNSQWRLTEVYVDEGITGTSTKKRYDFNRMINDAQNNKFDMIITKEISRFARNTLDSIYYTRKLKEFGIGVIFMNDNINTLDADSELRLTIMSSIAQEESRKTSERVKWGQKRRMEDGVVFGRNMLGYDVKAGNLTVDRDGADVVRQIFQMYVLEDKGAYTIAKELNKSEAKKSLYMKQWSSTSVLRILKNEKYCGDLVQKKTYTPNYLTHEKKYNNGEETFVIIKNHHEPIVSREMFEKAQDIIKYRAKMPNDKSKYSNRYCFSGKVKCGVCNSSFVSRVKKRKNGSINHRWKCFEAVKNGKIHIDDKNNSIGCNNISISNDDLKMIVMNVIQRINIIDTLMGKEILKSCKSISDKNNDYSLNIDRKSELASLCKKKKTLIELYISGQISFEEFKEIREKIEFRIERLKTESCGNINDKDESVEKEKRIINILKGIEWNDIFYRSIIEQIVVTKEKINVKIILIDFPFVFNLVA